MTLLRAVGSYHAGLLLRRQRGQGPQEPGPLVPLAEPLADKFVPLVKQYAPGADRQLSSPKTRTTLVRVNGASQLSWADSRSPPARVAGWVRVLLAGSLVPSTIAKHPFWSARHGRGGRSTAASS